MNTVSLNLSRLYANYKDWVRRNPQTASEVESAAKWLSYFIAGQLNKSIVLTELIYSASNLLVLFNDLIIQSAKRKLNTAADKIKIWLTVLEYSEVFIEISTKSAWGEKGKWIVITCVQLLKCTAKLVLLLHYNDKIISSPPIIPCKRNQKEVENKVRTSDGVPWINNIAFSLKRSGRVIRKVESAPPLNSRLWKPPKLSSCGSDYNELGGEPDKALIRQHLIGEFLYIIKPIVNLAVMMRCSSSSWKPWVTSAVLDLTSLHFLHSKPKNRGRTNLSQSQRAELSRRYFVLLLYLMRSPFYERHSKKRINSFLNGLSKNVPLARLICNPILQYLPHWQETYLYLWSS